MNASPRTQYLRRWRAFLLIWLLVLLVPPLRSQPWRLWSPNLAFLATPAPIDWLEPLHYGDDELGRLQRQEDAMASQVLREAGGPYSVPKSSPELLDPFFRLVREHPRAVWLKADTLRYATKEQMELDRDPHPPGTHWTAPVPRQVKKKPWLEPRLVAQCATLAHQGALQETDNGYFPVMEALFRFTAHQEDQGWAALRRAALCPRFNDYAMAGGVRRAQAAESYWPISPLQRMSVYSAVLMPHFHAIYQLKDAVCYRARQAREAGDPATAAKRYEAALTLGRSVRRSRDLRMSQRLGAQLEYDAWRYATGKRVSSANNSHQQILQDAEAYALLLRQYGAPERLAQISRADARKIVQTEDPRPERDQSWLVFQALVQGDWLKASLARLAWMTALLGACGAILRRASRWGTLTTPVLGTTVFTLFLTLTVAVGALWAGSGNPPLFGIFPALRSPGMGAGVGDEDFITQLFSCLLPFLSLLVPLWWWVSGGVNRNLEITSGGPDSQSDPLLRIMTVADFLLWVGGLSLAIPCLFMSRVFWDTFGPLDWPTPAWLAITLLATATMFHHYRTRGASGGTTDARSRWLSSPLQCLAMSSEVFERLALIWSVTYLVVVLALWPVNTRVDQAVRRFGAGTEPAASRK